MITKRKIYTKYTILVFLLIIITNINQVYADAVPISWAVYTPASISGGTPSTPPTPVWHSVNGGEGSNARYRYSYNTSVSPNTDIKVNVFDMNGNSITSGVNLKIDTNFLSGTWAGIYVYEIRTASWSISNIKVQEQKKIITCNYTYSCDSDDDGESDDTCYATSKQHTIQYWRNSLSYCQNNVVSTSYSHNFIEYTYSDIDADSYPSVVTAKINSAIISLKTSAKELANTQVGQVTITKEDLTDKTLGYTKKWDSPLETTAEDGHSGTYQQEYDYHPGRTCLNVKTGKVTYYYYESSKCKKDSEYDVTYGKSADGTTTFWRYFIPLNQKTKTNFSLRISKKTTKLRATECYSIINNYPLSKAPYGDYTNYIVRTDGITKYVGNTTTDTNTIKNEYGCRFSTAVILNPTQMFFDEKEKEETDELKLEGFDFYYQPIDISLPIPHSTDSSSYWYGKGKNNYISNARDSIPNSYSKITYWTGKVNANAIRSYNQTQMQKNNGYADWSTMNINGSSDFISKKGIVTRASGITFYKLGCGPVNADWAVCKT